MKTHEYSFPPQTKIQPCSTQDGGLDEKIEMADGRHNNAIS